MLYWRYWLCFLSVFLRISYFIDAFYCIIVCPFVPFEALICLSTMLSIYTVCLSRVYISILLLSLLLLSIYNTYMHSIIFVPSSHIASLIFVGFSFDCFFVEERSFMHSQHLTFPIPRHTATDLKLCVEVETQHVCFKCTPNLTFCCTNPLHVLCHHFHIFYSSFLVPVLPGGSKSLPRLADWHVLVFEIDCK